MSWLTFTRLTKLQDKRSYILHCPNEILTDIFQYLKYTNCVKLLSTCSKLHSICATRVYKLIRFHLPEDTWKLSYFIGPFARNYSHLIQTLVVVGTAHRNSRGSLHALGVALQRMSGLKTFILPTTYQHSENLYNVFEQYRIFNLYDGASNCKLPLLRDRAWLTQFIASLLPSLRHLTIGSPSNAIPMQHGRNITSLTLSKPVNSERLQLLVDGRLSLNNIRYLGVTCEGNFSAPSIVISLIPAFNIEILVISNGLSHTKVRYSTDSNLLFNVLKRNRIYCNIWLALHALAVSCERYISNLYHSSLP